ncbi:protein of unknown function [Serratia sp. Tan611]|nr:protein of unknown function [Serratia sp. Tan611]
MLVAASCVEGDMASAAMAEPDANMDAMTNAVTLRIFTPRSFRFASQRGAVYRCSCKHPSGHVKLRKVMECQQLMTYFASGGKS